MASAPVPNATADDLWIDHLYENFGVFLTKLKLTEVAVLKLLTERLIAKPEYDEIGSHGTNWSSRTIAFFNLLAQSGDRYATKESLTKLVHVFEDEEILQRGVAAVFRGYYSKCNYGPLEVSPSAVSSVSSDAETSESEDEEDLPTITLLCFLSGEIQYIENLTLDKAQLHNFHMLESLMTSSSSDQILKHRRIVIHGAPNTGKTVLAGKLIFELHKHFKHRIWIDAESYTSMADDFSQVYKELKKAKGEGGGDLNGIDIAAKVTWVKEVLSEHRSLLILDGLPLFDPQSDHYDPWRLFQSDSSITIVVTTRAVLPIVEEETSSVASFKCITTPTMYSTISEESTQKQVAELAGKFELVLILLDQLDEQQGPLAHLVLYLCASIDTYDIPLELLYKNAAMFLNGSSEYSELSRTQFNKAVDLLVSGFALAVKNGFKNDACLDVHQTVRSVMRSACLRSKPKLMRMFRGFRRV